MKLFRHHLHAALIWLAAMECLAFVFSVYLGAYMRFVGAPETVAESIGPIFSRAATFAFLMLISMAAMGLYQKRMREGLSGILIRTLGAFLLTLLALSVIFYLFPELLLGRGALGFSILVSFLLVVLIRSIFYRVVGHARLKRNVLVLGAGIRANRLLQGLRRKSDRRGIHLSGFVHIDGEETQVDEDHVVHLGGPICDYAVANGVDEILVAVDDRRRGLPIDDLLDCKLAGIGVVDSVSFFEREMGKIMLEFVTPGWLVFSDGFGIGFIKAAIKRGFDLTASFVLLMFTWPLMLLVVLAIWLDEGFDAPIIYRQQRVGLNGKLFDVLKFRSMRVDAEKSGKAVWAKKNDVRITRVGRCIRSCRIDELPQIINVMAGDMAFVGPRPERPEFVEKLEKQIPHYGARHQVKPGIAGWAQLCYPYGATGNDAREKLQYDLYYVKNNSLFLDLLILVQTLEVVLFGKGVR